jgi:hypothetical protein
MRIPAAKLIRRQILQSLLFAVLSPAPPVAAQLSSAAVEPRPAPATHLDGEKFWRVKYVGGSALLERSTTVELTLAADSITYRARYLRSAEVYSIPAARITEVSAEQISGKRDEENYGPGDGFEVMDPCAHATDGPDGEACVAILGGAELLSLSVRGILALVPYTNRFIRITWREPRGGRLVAVFQVRSEDCAGLLEAIESVAPQSGQSEAETTPQQVALDAGRQPAATPKAPEGPVSAMFSEWWRSSNPFALDMKVTAARAPLLNLGGPSVAPVTQESRGRLLARKDGE